MTTEIYENKDIKLISYYNGEKKVYLLIMDEYTTVEIRNKQGMIKEVLKWMS